MNISKIRRELFGSETKPIHRPNKWRRPTACVNFTVLEEKWKLFFRFLDFNKDQCIDEKDLDGMAAHIFDAFESSDKNSADICRALRSWWGVFKRHVGSARHISREDEFVAALRYMFESDRRALLVQVEEMGSAMFDLLDANGDGVITRSEYVKMFAAMGVANRCYVGRVFDKLDSDKSGVLERHEFQTALQNFFTSDKEENSMAFVFNFPAS